MSIDPRDRQRILEIAREVRKHVRRKSGAYCPPEGLCGEASIAISARLLRAKIPHEIWAGMWTGPITIEGEAKTVEDEAGFADPRLLHGSHRLHSWIEFPQYDGAILDVTADQFAEVPSIWFPANKQWFDKMEKYNIRAIYAEAKRQERNLKVRTRGISLSGPRFRRPPFKAAKVRVRQHLKHPPRSCLCHKSKAVNRARKSLVRRLK